MKCSNCQSGNTQTVKMMCLSGSSSSDSSAVGINTQLNVGIAKINTDSMSSLAKMYYPGKKTSNQLRTKRNSQKKGHKSMRIPRIYLDT